MSEPIDISKLNSIMQEIAKSCDINNDGKLEKTDSLDEISLFEQKSLDLNMKVSTSSSIFQKDIIVKSDNTRVARPILENELMYNMRDFKLDELAQRRLSVCKKMQEKWCGTFKNTSLKLEFFLKLYDVIDILNIKINDKDWDKNHYSSQKEQAMDEMLAMFAGESQLNPNKIGYVKKVPTFFGLFQLSQDGLKAAKKWATEHPEVSGMDGVSQNMTLNKFKNLKGEQQLDYFVAYTCESKSASQISDKENLSPAKIWSMVKFPHLNETIPQRRERREKNTEQKRDSIQNVFKDNKIPRG